MDGCKLTAENYKNWDLQIMSNNLEWFEMVIEVVWFPRNDSAHNSFPSFLGNGAVLFPKLTDVRHEYTS